MSHPSSQGHTRTCRYCQWHGARGLCLLFGLCFLCCLRGRGRVCCWCWPRAFDRTTFTNRDSHIFQITMPVVSVRARVIDIRTDKF